jgi:carbamoyltransferase
MIILGLNAFHADSSAALVRDGKLIAAAEEERFRRIKHWAGFPSQAIAYCLSEAGIKLSDIDHIAFNQDNRANLLRKITYFITKRPNINLVLGRLRNRRPGRHELGHGPADLDDGPSGVEERAIVRRADDGRHSHVGPHEGLRVSPQSVHGVGRGLDAGVRAALLSGA